MTQAELYRYGITAVIIVVIMALRFRNVGKLRPLKLEMLWIVPAIYLVATVATFVARPPVGMAWLWIAVALAGGAALGWQRGKTMHIAVDPETHALNQRASPAAILFIVVLVLVRNGAGVLARDHILPFDIMTITDVLMALGLGMFTVQRIEMFLRARRLLGEARAARAAA